METGIKKYMGIAIAICVGCAAVLSSGCKNLTASSEKALTSFAFKKDNNSWLAKDIVGTIDQASGTVLITVPESAYKYDCSSKKGKRKF